MSYADRIRQSADPREAMLVIAEGLDAVLERLAAGADLAPDGWGSWGGTANGSDHRAAPSAPDQDFYAAKKADPDYAGMERIQSTIDKLEARPMTPANQALLEQAYTALEKASRPGEYLDNSGGIVGTGGAGLQATETADGGYIVDLPPVDAKRKAMRQQLAEAIDLPGFFPPIMRTTEDQRAQIIRAYVLGGPRWLYANRIAGDADIFDQLPVGAKTVMVVDLMQDDQREAWEFQRDVMKTEDVEGTTLNIAKDNIDGIADGPRTELRG